MFLVVLTLSIYTFIDCARTPTNQMPAKIAKPLWLLFILLLPTLGPLIWLFLKYREFLTSDQDITLNDWMNLRRNSQNKKPNVAPDDDPDFLQRLKEQNERRAYRKKNKKEQKNDDDDDTKGLYDL